jgi:hypothetical protein
MGSELLETASAADDTTPPAVRAALELVARHGHLSPEKLKRFSPEDFSAITGCIPDYLERVSFMWDFMPPPTTLSEVLYDLCGWLNQQFGREATRNLHSLPEAERESFHARPVNQESWRQLRSRARWHSAPQRFRRDAYCSALRVRRGGQRTRRVRRVASSPRRARAPSHLGDDPEPDDDDHHLVLRRIRRLGVVA